jgi:Ni,Fe-hydrogenase III component G
MAEDKKGFVLYADQRSIIDMLPNDKAGELFKHIFSYVNDENPISNDALINLAFEPIKLQLKRDLLKWEETRLQRSKAGKISAERRKQQNEQVLTYVESVEQEPTNSTVIVNDKVNVKDKVINNIDSRKTSFANSLKPFLDLYGKEMLNDFYFYWTEHGDKDKKMRYEKQTSFNVELRLRTWNKRSNSFESKPKQEVLFVTPEGVEIKDKLVLHTYQQTGKI